MRNADAAQPHVIAGDEAMRIEFRARAKFETACHQPLRVGEILRRRDFHIDLFAGDRGDFETGHFRQRHIVRNGSLRVAAMGGEYSVEPERLRSLRAHQSVARHCGPNAGLAFEFQSVGDRHERNGAVGAVFERHDQSFDDRAGHEGPCRILDEDKIGRMRSEGFEPEADGFLPRLPAGHGRQVGNVAQARCCQIFLGGSDDHLDWCDGGKACKDLRGPAK